MSSEDVTATDDASGNCGRRSLRIPKGFQSLLEGFAREVLRNQPPDIYAFGAEYFDKKVRSRADPVDSNTGTEDVEQPGNSNPTDEPQFETQEGQVTEDAAGEENLNQAANGTADPSPSTDNMSEQQSSLNDKASSKHEDATIDSGDKETATAASSEEKPSDETEANADDNEQNAKSDETEQANSDDNPLGNDSIVDDQVKVEDAIGEQNHEVKEDSVKDDGNVNTADEKHETATKSQAETD